MCQHGQALKEVSSSCQTFIFVFNCVWRERCPAGWSCVCWASFLETQPGPWFLEGGVVTRRFPPSLGGWPQVLALWPSPPSWHCHLEDGNGTHSDLIAFLTPPFPKHGLTLALSGFPWSLPSPRSFPSPQNKCINIKHSGHSSNN